MHECVYVSNFFPVFFIVCMHPMSHTRPPSYVARMSFSAQAVVKHSVFLFSLDDVTNSKTLPVQFTKKI